MGTSSTRRRPRCCTRTPATSTAADGFSRKATSRLPMSARGDTIPSHRAPAHLGRYLAAGASLLGLVALILVFDWNWFKGPIERRVSAATGREFRIEGDLHVRLGLTPVISAEGLHFSNATWSKHEEMA